LLATQDRTTFQNEFLPVIESIITSYANGIHDHIDMDKDGLISAGNDQSQLTWMDARCEGVSFTPRFGKTVEVNALWINALQILAQTSEDPLQKQKVLAYAKKAQSSFRRVFWNDQTNGLNDCIAPDGSVDAAIRPNQIFAVSLPFGSLSQNQQKAVVSTVADELLTPFGLRSLSPRDSRYQGQYSGDPFQRDSAYHQGTVWAWLIGPFVEAHLKTHGYSQKAKQQAQAFLEPLLIHLDKDACLGSVSEIFDGDQPWPPKGCIAQAWSVAELLRCRKLLQ
ncbi:MAG: glycogen debranching protein, partial [Planctomycetes bacterium]|nr:glycogen debranching protein [Planctomycetota bacterium]